MTLSVLHHRVNQELAGDLREILREPEYIYVNSIEPERDRLPVPRGLIEGMRDAIGIADRKIAYLETIASQLAGALREILAHEPWRSQPSLNRVLGILGEVEEALK